MIQARVGVRAGAFLTCCTIVAAQVCSPPGLLCAKTTDCCRGCCEQYTCTERSFPCSADLIAVEPNNPTCRNYFCPSNQICYLRQVCNTESPCPLKPYCRTVYISNATITIHSVGSQNGGHEIVASSIMTILGLLLFGNVTASRVISLCS